MALGCSGCSGGAGSCGSLLTVPRAGWCLSTARVVGGSCPLPAPFPALWILFIPFPSPGLRSWESLCRNGSNHPVDQQAGHWCLMRWYWYLCWGWCWAPVLRCWGSALGSGTEDWYWEWFWVLIPSLGTGEQHLVLVLVLAAGPVLGVGCWYWVLIVGLALVCQVRTSSIAPVSFACKNLSNVPLPPTARRVGAVRGALSPCSPQGRCSSWAVGAVSQDITLHLNIVHCEFHQRTAKNWVYFPSLVHPWCPGVSCLSHPRWEGGSPHQGPGLVQVPPNEPAAIQQQMAWEGVRAMLSLPWGWDGTCGCCWGYWEAQGCSLSAACCCHPSCRQLRIFTASNDTESFSGQ